MLMGNFTETVCVQLVKEGIFEDLVHLQVVRRQMNDEIVGLPSEIITGWYRVARPQDEIKREILSLIQSRTIPKFWIEDSCHPYVPQHLEKLVKDQLKERYERLLKFLNEHKLGW